VSVSITDDQWTRARTAFREVGEKLARLVAEAPDPQAMATADWSVADVAAHVASLARLYTAMAGDGDAGRHFAGVDERIRATTVDTVFELNDAMMAQFPERDLGVLAGWLRSDLDQVLRTSEAAGPTQTVEWLGGARVPMAGLLSHLVNEMLLHGRDIARAAGPGRSRPRTPRCSSRSS
jgi:uncharacterized protein (TIGR03083 family)